VKLAIVHVTAAPEAVLQRAERRAAATGRVVPQEVREKTRKIQRIFSIFVVIVDLAPFIIHQHH
jgi:hypothetical protein